ncbi:MAG: ComEC/Rec2 family competence protein [Candidatus Pacebacteria bacterium]|nr:ComEC/Rec2 family competence protein [Candidatus Paceibacterota bacterium]
MNKKVLFILISLIIFNFIAWSLVLKKDDNLKVIFFNVGQGDSIFIETKEGHQILVDGGPDKSILNNLEKFMNPFDKEIDLIILTHPDKDHLGGLISVLKTYDVDAVIHTGAQSESQLFSEFENLIKDEKVITVDVYDKILVGDAEFEVYNPIIDVNNIGDLNDTSIVMKLIYGDSSFLLMGDLSINFEDDLIQKFNLRSDVLKVGHHGSKYSTGQEFLNEVSPNCAVIQVGKNSYGHPDKSVIELFNENNVKILRTDTEGDVIFYSDKQNIFLKK